MKKIFAIALALVMVLSMASAFASPCTAGFDWTTTAAANKCGKGSIEVVPYVKANDACEKYAWQVSTCAGAVNTEHVFYAVKLNVEANPDNAWWDKAVATLSYKGLEAAAPALASNLYDIPEYLDGQDVDDKANTFYFNFNTGYFDLVNDDFTFGGAYVKQEKVVKASEAKVCAKLVSKTGDFEAGIVGDYYVAVDYVGADGDTGAMLVVEADKGMTKAQIKGLAENLAAAYLSNNSAAMDTVLAAVPNAVGYIFVDGEVAVAGRYTDKCSTSFFKSVGSFLGIEIGTKMNQDLINKNFGWKNEQESCFSWSDKGASIVDAECVVAIPKTGDASVLAWLF